MFGEHGLIHGEHGKWIRQTTAETEIENE